jgi:signal transduction histidine kinase
VRPHLAYPTVEIRIADNGRGIPASVRTTLFEPFVSHGKENGTGLGLTVVQKIVQDHGGEVAVERTSHEGTVFRITVPRPAPALGVGEPAVAEDPPSSAEASVNSAKQA